MSLDVGERGHVDVEGAVNLPVNDSLAFRVAGFHSEEDGYFRQQSQAASRTALIAHDNTGGRISDALSERRARRELHGRNTNTASSRDRCIAPRRKGRPWDEWLAIYPDDRHAEGQPQHRSNQGLGEEDNSNIWSYGLQVDYDLGFATLTSQTGYKDHEYVYAEDFDAMPIAVNDYAQNQKGTYFEQEFRLVSQSTDAFSWYAGVSYYKEKIDVMFSQHADEDAMCNLLPLARRACDVLPRLHLFAGRPARTQPNQGQLRRLGVVRGPQLRLQRQARRSLGVRYTYDEKHFKIDALPVESELGPVLCDGLYDRWLSVGRQETGTSSRRASSCATTRPTTGWCSAA